MNALERYITYWYESADGDVEEFEISAASTPPATLSMPTATGLMESYILIDEECEDFGPVSDD
jgi:hypothetical protein